MCAAVYCEELEQNLTVLDALRAFESQPFVVLLDSAARHRERDARYSFLTAAPVATCRVESVATGVDAFAALRRWQGVLNDAIDGQREDDPPFCGGIAGLLSYELGHAFERLPEAIDGDRTPALLAGLFDWAIVCDHLRQTVRLCCLELPEPCRVMTAADRAAWVKRLLAESVETARSGTRQTSDQVGSGSRQTSDRNSGEFRYEGHGLHRVEPESSIWSNFTRAGYVEAVARVVEYIRAGDIFQANLSQQLSAGWDQSAVDLYQRVRELNPAPFCGLLQTDDVAVVSASPERFLKVSSDGHVETRPIKGTRRRLRSLEADLFAAAELAASDKDRAENVMIVDLLRNDLSRSCVPGSVRVTGLCEIERFETVLHLVSTIEGQLRPDRDVWDLLAGSFPGGSITGAPKIRAMEIITELEQSPRGAYCGSLFALGPRGDFDSNILIRTFTLRNGFVTFPVGGGIVADSNPLDEYRETLHKASGMIRCLR